LPLTGSIQPSVLSWVALAKSRAVHVLCALQPCGGPLFPVRLSGLCHGMAAEGRGPLLHARVGMLRAMNHGVERVFDPDRKDTNWGKRKMKRDE
jgi:hypothetical protein